MEKPVSWTRTYRQLSIADRSGDLGPRELENYALAAYLTDRVAACYGIMERAFRGHQEEGRPVRAGRTAFWAGLMAVNAGDKARGGGWFAKGERLLAGEQVRPCATRGLFLIPPALGVLYADHPEEAAWRFDQAASIGERFNDPDLIALGHLGLGQARIMQGQMEEGSRLLDETMITVESGVLHPVAAGIIYCAVIETYRKAWDLERAWEWTTALTRWCDAHPDIVPFRGQCLVRKAEILQFQGAWKEALEASEAACALLGRRPGDPAAGEAHYRRAELHRLMGDAGSAEAGFHEAAKRGRIPQPGLALLRLAQGRHDAAETSIRNILLDARDTGRRADLLPAATAILLTVEKTGDARQTSRDLCHVADELGVPYLRAMAEHYQGAVSHANGDHQAALEHLRSALSCWNRLQLPYEIARTRELKAAVYRTLRDPDNTDAELASAGWLYAQLHAKPDLERIQRRPTGKRRRTEHGLTLRELQVLRKVATGKTNRAVAEELFISERTVDRHMSNIFNKLGVSSRVAASTFAVVNNLLEDGA